jgi:hypothetical protein
MANILEEIVKDKDELIEAFLKLLEGKESRAKIKLDGVKFKVGNSSVRLEGNLELTLVPMEDKRK